MLWRTFLPPPEVRSTVRPWTLLMYHTSRTTSPSLVKCHDPGLETPSSKDSQLHVPVVRITKLDRLGSKWLLYPTSCYHKPNFRLKGVFLRSRNGTDVVVVVNHDQDPSQNQRSRTLDLERWSNFQSINKKKNLFCMFRCAGRVNQYDLLLSVIKLFSDILNTKYLTLKRRDT